MPSRPPVFRPAGWTPPKPWDRRSIAPRKQSRQARGYGAAWDRLRKQILERDRRLCQPCLEQGRYEPANEVDHRIPKAEGGDDDEGNLQAICTACHKSKTAAESARARRRNGRAALPVKD